MNKQSYSQRILDAPYPDIDYRNLGEELAYKVGCNAMRDVATGLASEADTTIAELIAALSNLAADYEHEIGRHPITAYAVIRAATLASLPAAELQP